jgi:hypothetical protein
LMSVRPRFGGGSAALFAFEETGIISQGPGNDGTLTGVGLDFAGERGCGGATSEHFPWDLLCTFCVVQPGRRVAASEK